MIVISHGDAVQELGLVARLAAEWGRLLCLLSIHRNAHICFGSSASEGRIPEFHIPRYLLFPLQRVARYRINELSDETSPSRTYTRSLVKMSVMAAFGSLRVMCDPV